MGFETVRDGEMVAVWARNGSVEFVRGPTRLFTMFKRVERLPLYNASQNQYLSIKFIDGHIENIPGPTNLFFNPLLHSTIQVRDAVSLTGHEALVVYRRFLPENTSESSKFTLEVDPDSTRGSDEVERNIIRGPRIYVPGSNEWVHEFKWHGTQGDNKTHLVPNARQFEKLGIIADQFYYNCRDVRTRDEALIEVKIMVFFELVDIEVMLDHTHDPIADLLNSACADVIAFTAVRSYEEFVEHTGLLNDLSTYPHLQRRAENVGYKIHKVVYRGYHACENLQRMHNNAIQARTKLRLDAETERQQQLLADLAQEKEAERASKELQMKAKQATFKQELEKEEANHENAMLTLKEEQKREQWLAEAEMKLEAEVKANQEKLNLWRELSKMGVDMTTYFTAEYQRPDKLIKLENVGRGENASNLHIHQQA